MYIKGKICTLTSHELSYSYIAKNGNETQWHHCHVTVLKKCFQMIPILYYDQKGNGT